MAISGNVRRDCEAGNCSAECADGCGCIASSKDPDDCRCYCYRSAFIIEKGGKKIPFKKFKPRIEAPSQTRYNICTHDLPIIGLARFLDKLFPNKILVPANRLTEKVTLSLKNNTLQQIIDASGLALKS
jgi:hypothetical protein